MAELQLLHSEIPEECMGQKRSRIWLDIGPIQKQSGRVSMRIPKTRMHGAEWEGPRKASFLYECVIIYRSFFKIVSPFPQLLLHFPSFYPVLWFLISFLCCSLWTSSNSLFGSFLLGHHIIPEKFLLANFLQFSACFSCLCLFPCLACVVWETFIPFACKVYKMSFQGLELPFPPYWSIWAWKNSFPTPKHLRPIFVGIFL